VALEVADRGRGFLPGDEQQVFEMFYRGADAKGDRRGTGLGLAICKAIVRAHDGVVIAKNRPGGGATIRFTLPSADEPPSVVDDGGLRVQGSGFSSESEQISPNASPCPEP
jgi:two-component system sensor histidine kinase KdpD